MILSDKDILNYVNSGRVCINPFNRNFVGPCSYDVTLGEEFITYNEDVYDVKKQLSHRSFKIDNSIMVCPLHHHLDEKIIERYKEKYSIDCVVSGGLLGTTNEYVELPNDVCAQYQGRSSFGRVFLQSHQTAGWIDSGFKGKITLEIVAYDKPVILYKNQRIGQLIFSKTLSPADIGYSDRKCSKYARQTSVMPSLIKKDFENDLEE
ncbi:deoxycytidine triphosphate deaminase [Methanococcus vannielii SB]|jgi:dCTP deaminase (dUMP-forming)|uniref:dCTP deaminase, dUMP-forming n=1 Tax=Methanococcus vannielii (strain ATCC 35089 / DSM 1224 / JCM 13029 / OCM 148 / SB) TaxID=406327 RepID=DCDB_METVS|nr:dCTP deaminase [Methanococcus vannielii]A6UQ71.1 RecName: Full=dCTP deaminase, dUMP-forming; AltName: Full=Bifunctional dCTP deaminase:dUTPase; AltName: Full=DCD-DUT [Methanococcus vannielii SB]ABR54643.1 deoxycytidine triphosphate deaminase [Methanococcus vannielii SB]